MSNTDSIFNKLRDIELFSSLSDNQISEQISFFTETTILMGEPIIYLNPQPEFIFILTNGSARQLVENPKNDSTITLSLHEPNYVIGWQSFSSGLPLEFVTAATNCDLLKIKSSKFQEILSENPIVYELFSKRISQAEVWPLINKLDNIEFPDKPIEFRTWIKNICLESKILTITSKDFDLELFDKSRIWFDSSNGELFNVDLFSGLEIDKFPLRFIGIPGDISFETLKTSQNNAKRNSSKYSLKSDISSSKETSVFDSKQTNKDNPKEDKSDFKFPFFSSPENCIDEAIACFRIIGETLNLPIKSDLIRRSFEENINKDDDSIDLQLCAAISESLGLKAQLLDLPLEFIQRVQTPALVKLNETEIAVLHDVKKDNLVIARPKIGLKTYTIDEFLNIRNNLSTLQTLILRVTSRTPRKKLGFKWFIPSIKKNRKSLIEVLVASLFVQLFQLMNPLIIQQIIDKVIGQGGISSLPALAILLFSFSIFENLLTVVRTNLFIDTTNRIDVSLGEQVIDHLLRLPLPFFDKRSVGELSSRVGELEQIRSFLTGTALTVILDAVFSFIYIAVMLMYSWILTIVSLLVAPLLAAITFLVSPIIRRQLRSKAELNAKTQNHLVEVLTGIQTVKAQNFELKARWKWKDRYTNYIAESYKNAVTSTTSNSITQFLNQASSLSVICVGAYLCLNGQLTLGQLIAFRIISGYVTSPLLRLSNLYQNLQQTTISLERLSDIIDTPQESTDTDKDNIPMPKILGSILFEEVCFRFLNNGPLILSNVNLELPIGQFVAVVGESGSGKSTLTKLISRLYEPLSGKIYVDNIDISKVELYSLRRQIGIVPQDSILFDGSVQDNIALTNPEASVEDVIRAAKIACAHDFIMDLSSGYATSVGERGSNLSGGQRQRIAIARSILQNPNILIMDESTSALDFETERKVSLNLMEYFRGKTVLFITHRLNSITHADKIITMHQGRVEEAGTHSELINLRGRYCSLFNQQKKDDISLD